MIINTVNFTTLDNIVDNLEQYTHDILNDGILVLRGAHLSRDDQRFLQRKIGDYLKIFPNSQYELISEYTEDHKARQEFNVSTDEIMLPWHMEHLYFINPIVLGFWNMEVFTVDSEIGQTFFYDSRKLYSRLPQDWQEFLSKCVINVGDRMNLLSKISPMPAIAPHWSSGEPVVRIPIGRPYHAPDVLQEFDGRAASDLEKDKYVHIVRQIKDIVDNDEDNRIIHKWQEGDLVISDIFVMIHAVTGGFKPHERIFTGMWSFKENLAN